MKNDLKVDKEIQEILKKTFDIVKEANGRYVPIGLIMCEILDIYTNELSLGEDELLRDYFNSHNFKTKFIFREQLKAVRDGIIDGIREFEVPSDFPFVVNENAIAVDQYLVDVFLRVQKQAELWFDKPEGSTITASMMYLALCWDTSEPILMKLLQDFDLTKEDFIKYLSTKQISKLKTKSLENLGEVTPTPPYSSSSTPDDDKMFEEAGNSGAINSKPVNPESETPFLDLYSYDMSQAARVGKYDPVVGRTSEIDQITKILCCRKKNNAVLLGDPGCGKTAIIELLAQKIESGDVPDPLKGKRICSLDLNALVSGTKYRGEYEQRLQGIIKEVCANPEIIVYIDEFHNLVGNGGSSGNGDGANILKPYLARGEFQCIGSTTLDEYRKWVEKDGALKRRFQNVMVDEPTPEDTVKILETLAKKYGEYHRVRYPQEVIKACVEWSGRYIQDRYFPDKAIDCLDMAGSLTKLSGKSAKAPSTLETLQQTLEDLKQKKINALIGNRFEEGSELKKKQEEVERKIAEEKRRGVSEKERRTWPEVTLKEVSEVIAGISKVPIDKISESDMEKLRDMKQSLEKKVIGQEEAVKTITISLQRNFLGLRDPQKPIASLLLVGPTGTGKTLICKEMAKEFFGSEKALIKFDMAEFSEHHEVTKLTGSTASYVGYDDSPLLEQVRRQPYSVVLFDEIEKAAPEIFNIFLSILQEGNITLGNGTKVDFKNCIIVFTGNIGTKELAISGKGLGYVERTKEEKKKSDEKTVIKAVEKTFRPEFINRLSSITVFNELGKDEMMKIFELEILKLKNRLKSSGYTLNVDKKVKELCVSQCDPKYGARSLQRVITKNIEDVVCQAFLDTKEIGKKISVKMDSEGKIPCVEFKTSGKKKSPSKESLNDESTSTIIIEEKEIETIKE